MKRINLGDGYKHVKLYTYDLYLRYTAIKMFLNCKVLHKDIKC